MGIMEFINDIAYDWLAFVVAIFGVFRAKALKTVVIVWNIDTLDSRWTWLESEAGV